MRTVWSFFTAPGLYFGRGAVKETGGAVRALGASRALVVTDTVLAGLYLEQVAANLEAAGVSVSCFEGGAPEPTAELVEEALQSAKRAGCDVIVAIGGGSNTDLAKGVSLLLTHGGHLSDYLGECKVPGPVMPVVSISTTAGTGSEVSGVCVLTDTAQRIKIGIADNALRPRVAIYDPGLTVTCPPAVTADAGLDALTHAVEAYTSVDHAYLPVRPGERIVYQGKNPLADLLAEEAVRLVGRHLVTAYYQPQNLEAREGMHLASLLAGMAFSNAGVTATHALEYAVGPAAHVTHGLGNGLLLPYVMEYNLPARPAEFARVAELLGEQTAGLTDHAAGMKAIEAVRRLRRTCGIPDRLREIGIREEQLPELARKAASASRILRNQPRPAGDADLLAILKAAH